MASRFERGINLLRFQMIYSTEKLGLLCKWIIFKKVDDPELKAFLKVCDNLEKAAAVLVPLDPIDGTSNEDLAAELHIDSIGLKESFSLVNEMKAQFEDLKTKLDLIVSWIISKTLDDNDLKEFLNLTCQYETAPASVLLPLTDQMISNYLQEFSELKSKMELAKTKLKLICGWIIYKNVEDLELKGLLKHLCNQEKAYAAPDSLELVNDDTSTFGESEDEVILDESEEPESEFQAVEYLGDLENELDPQGGGSEVSFVDDESMYAIDKANRSKKQTPLQISKPKRTIKTTASKNQKCNVCHKKFKGLYDLKRHFLVHSKQKSHACDVCEKQFGRVDSLKSHKTKHEALIKHYRCDTCTKEFTTARAKKVHEKTHTGEKNYCCDVCQKRFTQLGSLTAHKRIHTKEKPYNCTQCVAKFARLTNLKRHQLTHTGEKPHNCIFCGKNFRHRNALIGHLRIHTGEKPFECLDCHQQFRTTSNLQIHQKKHYSTE